MRRLAITALAAALLPAATVPSATAAARLRPSDVPPAQVVTQLAPNAIQIFNDYATPPRSYPSQHCVVHYVVLGIDAPPLNDDDGDGVPDYVERVGEAADTAISYYERRGFARILADAGGPDARPDIYVSRFAPGYFGVAFPAADAEGGAFVAVSNALDPSSAQSLGSLYGTVTHELFHLVQFSYFAPGVEPEVPTWALEGAAAAMESRVYPDLADIVSSLQLRSWFAAPQRSVMAQSYGSQLLWHFLDERQPRLLPAYLTRLARPGATNAAAALAATYTQVAGRPFAQAFGQFAAWVAGEYADRITPLRLLDAEDRTGGRVAPLAIHFLRLPRTARSVSFRFTRGRGEAVLTYELESDRAGDRAILHRLRARVVNGEQVYRIPPRLRRSDRFTTPTLVVANGQAATQVGYSVSVR